jgi:hypothetical protein
MMKEEQIVQKATKFFEQVAAELHWSPAKLSKHLLEVKLEINAMGIYQHTSQEIELEAWLAWCNSVSSYMDKGSYANAKTKTAKHNGNHALTWLSKMKQTD